MVHQQEIYIHVYIGNGIVSEYNGQANIHVLNSLSRFPLKSYDITSIQERKYSKQDREEANKHNLVFATNVISFVW